jgi:hypothetical protein
MKKLLGIIVLSLFFFDVSMANEVELKGFKLGMTKKEFKKNWKKHRVKVRQSIASLILPHYTVTLAGVNVDKP